MTTKQTDPHPVATESGESFLQRFHRRKLAARRGEVLPDEPSPAMPPVAGPPIPPDPEPVLTDADMPPVESLTGESDFSGFLSPGVSEDLRRAALRRLWQVADIDFVDDLDVYAGDYTRFEPLGGLITREMQHRLELAARREAERLADDGQAAALAEDDEVAQVADNPPLEQRMPAAEPDQEESDAG